MKIEGELTRGLVLCGLMRPKCKDAKNLKKLEKRKRRRQRKTLSALWCEREKERKKERNARRAEDAKPPPSTAKNCVGLASSSFDDDDDDDDDANTAYALLSQPARKNTSISSWRLWVDFPRPLKRFCPERARTALRVVAKRCS